MPSWAIYGNERRRGPVFPAVETYTGPGNIVSGATAWFGLRAYSAAMIGTNCIRLVRASDSAEQNFITLASGAVDLASITTFLAATTGKVVTWYDQSGNGNDATQATDPSRPDWTFSALGSFPGVTFLTASLRKTLGGAISQPFSTSCVANRTLESNITFCAAFSGSGNGQYFRNANDEVILFAGGVSAGVSAVDAAPHALNGTFDGASSALMVDGSNTTGLDPSTGAFGTTLSIGDNGSGVNFMVGHIFECGVWPTGFTGTQRTNIDTNQQTYWGF